MPKYFFDIYDGETDIDPDGYEFPDLVAAEEEAVRALSEIAMDRLPPRSTKGALLILIRDEAGVELLTVVLDLAVRHRAAEQS